MKMRIDPPTSVQDVPGFVESDLTLIESFDGVQQMKGSDVPLNDELRRNALTSKSKG